MRLTFDCIFQTPKEDFEQSEDLALEKWRIMRNWAV